MRRNIFVAILFLLVMFSSYALAQKNEISFVAGGTFSPDTTTIVHATGVGACTITSPNCATVRRGSGIETKTGFEGTYAHRIFDLHAASFWLELPVLGVPDRQVRVPPFNLATLVAPPRDFSSIFITPSLKVKFLPDAPITPFVSVGGGFAHYSSRTLLEVPGASAVSSTSNTTGAFQIGGGIDIKTPLPHLGFRAEVREFWSGQPTFASGAKLDHHQNLFAGGGIVFRF
jgi:hypothetical protein